MDKELVVNAFVAIYEAEPATLSRILDVTLEIQELKAVLDWKPLIMFSVDLACLASLRDALDLSRWLDDAVQKFGPQAADVRSPQLKHILCVLISHSAFDFFRSRSSGATTCAVASLP